MSVGLPGTGIGGLFFIISAVLTLPIELVRFILGRGSLARLKVAVRHAVIALTMVGMLMGSYWAVRVGVGALQSRGSGASAPRTMTHVLPVAPLLLTLGVLAAVLTVSYLHRILSAHRRPAPAAD
jgi:hypothetical protein